jgi:hypothetical protein
MYTHVLSKPARTLGARSAAKTGGTSSSFFSPAATEFYPLFEVTMVCKTQQKTILDKIKPNQSVARNQTKDNS